MKNRMFLLGKSVITRFAMLDILYRSTRAWLASLGTPRKSAMGFYFAGNDTMANGMFEIEETKIIRSLIEQVDVVVNIGANIGYYCCIACSLGKYVIAFEPVFSNVRMLLKNIEYNCWGNNIEVYPVALSNSVGILKIYGVGTGASLVKGWSGTSERFVNFAPSSTLDLVVGWRLQGKRTLVIVDIEGAESLMLDGARCFASAQPKPIWFVEIAVSEHQPSGVKLNPKLFQTFAFFWERGYEAWTAQERRRKILPDEVQRIVNSGVDSLGCHNVLFIDAALGDETVDD